VSDSFYTVLFIVCFIYLFIFFFSSRLVVSLLFIESECRLPVYTCTAKKKKKFSPWVVLF